MPSRRFHNFSNPERDRELKLMRSVFREVRTMTDEEFTASLIRAGILTKSGKRLTKPFRELYEQDMAIIEAANAREPRCECGRPLPGAAPPAPAQASSRKHKAPTPRRRSTTVSPRRSTTARHKRRP
jgi:hypothetical protein